LEDREKMEGNVKLYLEEIGWEDVKQMKVTRDRLPSRDLI
jgi:hypothetical protein